MNACRTLARRLVEERFTGLTVAGAREAMIAEYATSPYPPELIAHDIGAPAWLYVALIQYGPERGDATVRRECDALRASGWDEDRNGLRSAVIQQLYELLTEYDERAWIPLLVDTVHLLIEKDRREPPPYGFASGLLHEAAATLGRVGQETLLEEFEPDRAWFPIYEIRLRAVGEGIAARLINPSSKEEVVAETAVLALERLAAANGWRLVSLGGDRYVALPPTPAD